MKQDELENLSRRYLAMSFDEIEDRMALDWSPEGLEEHSFDISERCHDLSDALAAADVSSTIELARQMPPLRASCRSVEGCFLRAKL